MRDGTIERCSAVNILYELVRVHVSYILVKLVYTAYKFHNRAPFVYI
jgi:hypothetical protein